MKKSNELDFITQVTGTSAFYEGVRVGYKEVLKEIEAIKEIPSVSVKEELLLDMLSLKINDKIEHEFKDEARALSEMKRPKKSLFKRIFKK